MYESNALYEDQLKRELDREEAVREALAELRSLAEKQGKDDVWGDGK